MHKVSILIPCYNAERWIAAAIQSALDQTHENKEVIVVDDGSTDGSAEIIKSFGDQITWETGPNCGGNVARNRLLELSSGDWLQYLDADDYLEPNKVEVQLCFTEPGVDVVYSPTTWLHCDPAGNELGRKEFEILGPHDPWKHLILWRLPQTGGSLWRKTAIQSAGGWKEDQPCCQEHELYYRLLADGAAFTFCPENGAVYRQWSEQTVCRKSPLEAVLRRMEIIDRCEKWLHENGGLSASQRDAIAETRYECARKIFNEDRDAAMMLAEKARNALPDFSLPPRDCFPLLYRLTFKGFGFLISEQVAASMRRLRH